MIFDRRTLFAAALRVYLRVALCVAGLALVVYFIARVASPRAVPSGAPFAACTPGICGCPSSGDCPDGKPCGCAR